MASRPSPTLNPWEIRALEGDGSGPASSTADGQAVATASWQEVHDPMIYPGLYSATGFDVMSILLRVTSRPNPSIDLGRVDCSVAMVVCDLQLPDVPIVYASDAFCELTGYSMKEVLGRNCRFLQFPGGKSRAAKALGSADKAAVKHMRHAVRSLGEIQLPVTNYKKNGVRFTNIVSIVPVEGDTPGYRYAVGFQVSLEGST